MIKAIFFDLHGTLLSHTTRCIPQDTLQALRKLRDKGIRIYINYVDDTVRKNGGDCVRKIADYVTSGVDDDGIGKALRYFHII